MSKQEYERVLAKLWTSNGAAGHGAPAASPSAPPDLDLTVAELLAHVEQHHRHPDESPTSAV